MVRPRPVSGPDNKTENSPRRPPLLRVVAWPRWVTLAIVYFALLTGLGIVGGYSLNDASAANWVGPTANPPLGNIPVPVWNRLDTTQKQENTAVDVDGYVAAGSPLLDLGSGLGGENVIYGLADYAGMYTDPFDDLTKGTSDYLILTETVQDGVYTNRFRVDREGNLLAAGDIYAGGCLGPVFVGMTGGNYKGDLSVGGVPNPAGKGYLAANDKCAVQGGQLAGSHICSAAEILNSIKCAETNTGIRSGAFSGLDAWIQGGPPGYVAPANDCQGWQSANSTDFGRIWRLDATKGGAGFLSTCNQEIRFACCR